MKNNILKSFRFEIVLYSLFSLICALVTEAGIFYMVKVIRNIVMDVNMAEDPEFNGLSNNREEILNNQSVPQSMELARDENIGLFIGCAILLGVILFVIYFLICSKRFTNYLEEITVGINEMSSGNFTVRIPINTEDEFGIIARRLNKMAEDIQVLMENEKKNEQAKNELITSVAHDLRTPLTSIIGYLDLASKEESGETRQKYFKIAYIKSLRLEKLIADLFNYTKFNMGEIKLVKSEIDMVKFIEQMMDEFYPGLQEAALEYEYVTNDSTAIIMADGDLLARAFGNLIGNAVKYGRDGKILRIKLIRGMENLKISIINYGEVIPKEDLENIFDKFYRVESSRSSETGGSGLGLAIAKRIILMHDGTIKAISDRNGTVFEVELQLKKAESDNEVKL